MTQTWLRWLPALSTPSFIGLLLLSVAIAVGVRIIWGRGLIGKHWLIWLLRCASIALVLAILMGPTQVEQTAPIVSRPKMLFLFDGSSSMKLGAETSRWQDALAFVESSVEKTRDEASSDCQSYRFGHRLGPLSPTVGLPTGTGPAATTLR